MPSSNCACMTTSEIPTPEEGTTTSKRSEAEFTEVTRELTNNVKPLKQWAALFITLGIAAAVVSVGWLLPNYLESAIREVDTAKRPEYVLAIELFRGAAFATILVSLVFALMSLGRAFLDQATRYEKRLVASHFLNFVLARYEKQIRKGQIELSDVVSFIEAWSSNVESAFTNVKMGSRRQEPASIRIGSGGLEYEQGDARRKKKR